MRRVVCISLCLILCISLTAGLFRSSASAVTAPDASDVAAAYLVSLNSDQVLFTKDADRVIYPASTAKIMTGLLACRLLAERQDESVTLTEAMLSGASGRSLHLAPGEELTIRDLLYAALCGGYNDATMALAVLSAGSVAEFVSLMNLEAGRLGTTVTHFTDPTGLHNDEMVTTAREVAVIARAAWQDELFMSVVSATSYTIPATQVSEPRTIYNRNLLLSDSSQNYRNGYCRGISAGMTDEGGWCIVTVYEREGVSLLCVVMGGDDVPSGEIIPAYTRVNALLGWARQNYGYRRLYAEGDTYDVLSVGMTGLSSSRAQLILPEGLSAYLPLDVDEQQLTYSLILEDGTLEAPLTAGEIVGTLTVRYGNEVLASAPVAVTEDFAPSRFLLGLRSFRSYLSGRAFVATLACFVLLTALYIATIRKRRGRYTARRTRSRTQLRRLRRSGRAFRK